MKTAFLFPGQGSQKPGLLHDLPETPAVQKVLTTISQLLDEDVFCFHTAEALRSTKAVQLSLLIAGIATFKAFEEEGVKPDFVAGHSVGAFGAAVASGVIDMEDAVELVELRGELMENAYPEGYGMGVVLGLDEYDLQSIINQNNDEQYPVYLANKNSPDQITISGALSSINNVLKGAEQKGARCTSLLNVSVPSHCSLLDSVAEELSNALNKISFHKPLIPYVSNQSARLLYGPEDIRRDLAESVAHSVKWHDASSILYEKGARLFIEMPPGNVLARLATKAFPGARVMSIADNGFADCLFMVEKEMQNG
ncbi:MAG TPA: malonate decarboxylase subunit epsilon [Bacillales bacterium]|nr:malonate decarboxylase subunit epsilon [Bacillales bacterium]